MGVLVVAGTLTERLCGAKELGATRATLSRLINRKAAVSAEMAVRLEKAIGSTAHFWLRLQLNHDLARIQARSGKIHARRIGPRNSLRREDAQVS